MLTSTDKTQTPSLLKMTLHRLSLKGAQEKDKTPPELQWNWLELQCWLIKTVHRLIPQCVLTGLRETWTEVQSGDDTAEAVTLTLMSYWLSWWLACWVTVALGFIHPVFIFPDAEPFNQILGALEFGVKAIFLPFESGHILHRHKYHLLLTVGMFGFDLQLLNVLVPDLWSFSGAPALVGFCTQEV